jgi:tetratricopeptide (TPR) repeat protein
MPRFALFRHGIAALLLVLLVGATGAAWPPEKFTNLKALPPDIPQRELIDMMRGFTVALDVRCTHCHVGEEGKPLTTYRFELDDKPAKRKAREMIRMMNDLNDKYLANLETRAEPAVRVQCATCHRGVQTPRMLQEELQHAYDTAGVDSALATYHGLRARYYGRFAYDFSDEPLSDVGSGLWDSGKADDAVRLFALNVEKNPESAAAKQQHGLTATLHAFRTRGIDAGTGAYRSLREAYGAAAFPEQTFGQMARRLMTDEKPDHAIAVGRLWTEAFPNSAAAFERLGAAGMKQGDRALARESWGKALALDPANAAAKTGLESLGGAREK